ncbi:hypothetical protein TNCT_568371 [Trichonephila clavata]|uniref:Uncharacterized protein n=1 Tax=Trichonephila clavata TaxID=2740835 RepID=A0A8X6LFI7_TRICU|nr:hypothetical protein TNCT_568371 [Trichonephila clavata]
MFKESDETKDSDIIRQLGYCDAIISKVSSNLDTEEVEIPDSTDNPKFLQENNPQQKDVSKNLSGKNKISVAESTESKNENVCKICGEEFEDFLELMVHDCLYKDIEKESFHISEIFGHLLENKTSELVAENSANENISVSSKSKMSSPSCKISKEGTFESPSSATSKQLSSPSTKELKGIRSVTSSVASHKLQSSRRSFSAAITILPEKNSITRSKESHISQSQRSYIATIERPPEVEMLNRVYTNYSTYGAPSRCIPSSHTHEDKSSGRVMHSVPVNLFQLPRINTIQKVSDSSESVVIPGAINFDQPTRIYSTETYTGSSGIVMNPNSVNLQSSRIYNTKTHTDSSGIVMNPVPVNLFQLPQIYTIQKLSDSSKSLMIPGAINLDEPSRIYDTETYIDSSRIVMNPNPINLQSCRIYNTETLTDSSGIVKNPMPINLFQLPQIYTIQKLPDSSESLVIPGAINLDQPSQIYNTPTHTYSSGIVMNPDPVNIQSSWIYKPKTFTYSSLNKVIPEAVHFSPLPQLSNTETLKDSSGSVMNPTDVIVQPSRMYNTKTLPMLIKPSPVIDFKPPEIYDATIKTRSVRLNVIKSPKNSFPSSEDSTTGFKFCGAASHSQSPQSSTHSGDETFPRMKCREKYYAKFMSIDIPVQRPLKTYSKASIVSKESEKANCSESSLCSSTLDKLTPDIESGESKSLSFGTPMQLSPSLSACIKEFSEGSVNRETKDSSQLPQNPNILDKKISSN